MCEVDLLPRRLVVPQLGTKSEINYLCNLLPLKHSVVLSNTTFSKASKPFKTPVAEDRSKYTIKLWVTFSNAMRRSNSDHFLNIWTKLLMNTESANKKPLLLNKRRFITIHTIEATSYSI